MSIATIKRPNKESILCFVFVAIINLSHALARVIKHTHTHTKKLEFNFLFKKKVFKKIVIDDFKEMCVTVLNVLLNDSTLLVFFSFSIDRNIQMK